MLEGMLESKLKSVDLTGVLLPQNKFHPFPTIEERYAWEALPLEAKALIRSVAGAYEGVEPPAMSASLYMEYAREGVRERFESAYFARRKMLLSRTLGLCVSGGGDPKDVDDLANIVWAICEESTWVVPAHVARPDYGSFGGAVADAEAPMYIDLFAAETASFLAWTYYLAGAKLAEASPLIPKRIAYEIERRALDPFLLYKNFHWMGLNHGNPVNNWNPWINANLLAAALIIEPDDGRRARIVEKICRSLDRFLSFYAEDGGCDEGSTYFGMAGGAMFDALSLLNAATNGAIQIYDQPLFRNMAEYIAHAHIAGAMYINFADADMRVPHDAAMLGRAGAAVGSGLVRSFADHLLAVGASEIPYEPRKYHAYRQLCDLFDTPDDSGDSPAQIGRRAYTPPREHYFAGIQLAIAREGGLFLAAKGGTNDESHNHNDIGNYVIYLDGEPMVADIGVETYTKKTFGPLRYEIWTMQSKYHNTAIINGCDQEYGREYAARGASFSSEGGKTEFTLDMAGAYGREARVVSYVRKIELDRAAGVIEVTDDAELAESIENIVLPIILAAKPTLERGRVLIPGRRALLMEYDADQFGARLEELPIPDQRLQAAWARPCLYRLLLTEKRASARGRYVIRYSME
ncbi:MAG: heparinase II/III-family protein [Oscillospiraceae bacterium]|jgi:hypothetical protein|nr:heparinase II/III-family protein [Oscillospiraceae bacterium]